MYDYYNLINIINKNRESYLFTINIFHFLTKKNLPIEDSVYA